MEKPKNALEEIKGNLKEAMGRILLAIILSVVILFIISLFF